MNWLTIGLSLLSLVISSITIGLNIATERRIRRLENE